MTECASPYPPPAPPFAGAYTAFAQVFPELRIQHRRAAHPHEGWVRTPRLLADPALRARLIATEARHGLARYGTAPRPDVAAGFWLHRYTWPLCLLFTLPWLLERRVPLPTVAQLASRRAASGGGPAELALLAAPEPIAFACLPGDPAARLPGARPVADEPALRTALRAALAEQLAPLLAAFRGELRRGPRTLWGLATDEVVEGLWYAAGLLGQEARALAELAALLPEGADSAPFVGAAAFRTTAFRTAAFRTAGASRPAGPPTPVRTRVSCCLYYTVRPADPCVGCPRSCG